MAVRYRKYFSQCKPISCNGKRNGKCPEIPKKRNGQYKACGVWCIEFFGDCGRWQSLTFKDITCKTEAERRYMMFISDRERGKLGLPEKKQIPTLVEYSKTYMGLQKHARENTLAMKKRAVKALAKHLGDYRLDKITPFMIERYRLERKEERKIKDSSLNVDLAILTSIFNLAARSGVIDKNPCRDVKKAKTPQVKDKVLSGREIALLLDKLKGKDRLMFLTGLLTGMRLNEVLSLNWSDVDFNKGIISYQASKTGKHLTIPLPELLAKELSIYKKNNHTDRIFEDRPTTHGIIVYYSRRFSKLFKDLGIPGFTYHGLRHTFSSILQGELGIGAVIVQTLTGHSSLGMLQRYSHSGLDNKKTAINALSDYVYGKTQEETTAMNTKKGTA